MSTKRFQPRIGEGRRRGGKRRVVRSVDSLTVPDFAPLRGTASGSHPTTRRPLEAELVELTEIARDPGRAPLSLVFQRGSNPPLPQRIYRVEHEALGAIERFLVPIASDRYEAVFT